MEEFISKEDDFEADPNLIRVIILVTEDTLLMPPRTIHAPILLLQITFSEGGW